MIPIIPANADLAFGAKFKQDNSIERIENLTRLRSLEYLNLSMNSVERIENLETCEALERLDLTLNFIGELTGGLTELAKGNPHLGELHLTGNPCSKYVCSKEYTIRLWVSVLDRTRSNYACGGT